MMGARVQKGRVEELEVSVNESVQRFHPSAFSAAFSAFFSPSLPGPSFMALLLGFFPRPLLLSDCISVYGLSLQFCGLGCSLVVEHVA